MKNKKSMKKHILGREPEIPRQLKYTISTLKG